MVKVSAIIPVFNAEKTLIRCVESLVLGKYNSLEVLLIDDCSEDQSWNICTKISSLYTNVICYQNERKSGTAAALYRGIREAKGEYLVFVNCHDWVSSEYVLRMVGTAEEYPDYLTICGYCVSNGDQKEKYIWDDSQNVTVLTDRKMYAVLFEKGLLHQLWNKVFRKNIIQKSDIRFSESMNSCNQLSFVLDYLEASGCTGAAIVNKALYYYRNTDYLKVTANHEDMMRLSKLSGLSETEIQNRYLNSRFASINRVYTGKTKALQVIKNNFMRIQGKVRREIRNREINKIRKNAVLQDITIISQNCIGGVFYHDMGMQFLSPTVNLFFYEPDFLKFVLNLEYYLSMPMKWRWEEEYPVGMLGDIEIHFMHYDNCMEAQEAWERRCGRIRWDRILILSTDREGFDRLVFEKWKTLSYPKLLFTAQKEFADDADSVFYPEYEEQGYVGDLISERRFYREGKLIEKLNCYSGN